MIRGFSFVLVVVVMVVMLVFGLLVISSTGADLRLSGKALAAQQVFYELDTRGENIKAECANAVAAAQNSAKDFMHKKLYQSKLPDDFFAGISPLANEIKSNPNSKNSSLFQRGVFFYYLDKELKKISAVAYTLNQDTLKSVLNKDKDINSVIVVLGSTIASGINDKNSLQMSLELRFGDSAKEPEFIVTNWSTNVSGLTIDEDTPINVWEGK